MSDGPDKRPDSADTLLAEDGSQSADVDDQATIVSAPEEVEDEIPGYEILHTLGRGGMGEVLLAQEREGLKRRVAIKTILSSRDNDYFRRKFMQEGQRQAKVEHPNILPIYGVGQTDKCLYLVMQAARDGDLRGRMKNGPIAPGEAARIVACVARALVHAHYELDQPVIHLDIKPDNILFSGDNPMLSDFGIARDIDGEVVEGTVVAGDPRYWAPEQQANKSCKESDIYALGVTFFELLTGERPDPVMRLIRTDEDRQQVMDQVPAAAKNYAPLVADCLMFDAKARPDARQLLERLADIGAPEAPVAPTRNMLLALTLVVALGLGAGLVSPAVRDGLAGAWAALFPAASHEVVFTVSPAAAEVWVDGERQSFRKMTLAEGERQVAVVAEGFVGQHRSLSIDSSPAEVQFELSGRPAITDEEFLRWSGGYGDAEKEVELFAASWADATLTNMVRLEAMHASDSKELPGFVSGLRWLAIAGDPVAQSTLFYASFEGLPVPGERSDYMAGLVAASNSGYALATVLQALHIIEELLGSGTKFDEDMDAFARVTNLLKKVRDQGMPATAATFAGIIGADLSQ